MVAREVFMFNATKSMKLVARVQEKILFMFEIKV
jgi:hypothetical protein